MCVIISFKVIFLQISYIVCVSRDTDALNDLLCRLNAQNVQLHNFLGTSEVTQSIVLSVLKEGENLLHSCGFVYVNVVPGLNNV